MIQSSSVLCHQVHTIVVGSGAAGLRAAERLFELGHKDIALVTEGMECGTSRNTGSDKQTYYKLSLSGSDADSVREMAATLFGGHAVDGDVALCEAAASAGSFSHLVQLGVPFPTNEYGEYVGYKTDHDPYRRATSAGPYTSKLMTEALERSVRQKGIQIWDHYQAIELLADNGRVYGLVCLDLSNADDPQRRYAAFYCAQIIWATGGPAGMYFNSVYPSCHYGATGIAFAAGAAGQNLTEWQFGLASLHPRWNVSGTYMQVLPRFISTDQNGGDEREFLLDAFDTSEEALANVFLKGYQWPFDVRKATAGSSRIDLLVHNEQQKGRRIFLDFRDNPGRKEVSFSSLPTEVFDYLNRAGACFGKPIDRLLHMNEPAVDFYMDHGVDLRSERLEIALCVQHNNGGIAVDKDWQTNIRGLYAAGEAAATHGVYRPGGSALNAGQAGALRAAQAASQSGLKMPSAEVFNSLLSQSMKKIEKLTAAAMEENSDALEVYDAYCKIRKQMDKLAGPVRKKEGLSELLKQIADFEQEAEHVYVKRPADLQWVFRLRETLLCQRVYVEAMLDYLEKGGKSRGSAMYIDPFGSEISNVPGDYRFSLDGGDHADVVQQICYVDGECRIVWRSVRPVPAEDESFEVVWKNYRQRMNRAGAD